jgi:hypothetical protein
MTYGDGWIATREASTLTGPIGARPALDTEALDPPITEVLAPIAGIYRTRHAGEDLPIPESEDPARRTAVLRTLAQSPGAAAALAGLHRGIMSFGSSFMIDLRPHYV